jgi:hypothetical protein
MPPRQVSLVVRPARGDSAMLHPAHVDGRSLVILQRRGHQFSVAASGQLEHDGETLALVGDGKRRVLTRARVGSVMVVRPDTKIAECRGFDLFLIEGA